MLEHQMAMLRQTEANHWTPVPIYEQMTILKPAPKVNNDIMPYHLDVKISFPTKGKHDDIPIIKVRVLDNQEPADKPLYKRNFTPKIVEEYGFNINTSINMSKLMHLELIKKNMQVQVKLVKKKLIGDKVVQECNTNLSEFTSKNQIIKILDYESTVIEIKMEVQQAFNKKEMTLVPHKKFNFKVFFKSFEQWLQDNDFQDIETKPDCSTVVQGKGIELELGEEFETKLTMIQSARESTRNPRDLEEEKRQILQRKAEDLYIRKKAASFRMQFRE